MKMNKTLIAGLAAAGALLMSAPVWAGGHGHGRGHGHGHGHGHHVKHHYHGHHHHVRHHYSHSYVVRERYYPAPVYAAPVYPAPVYAAPAPGISVVLPSIFIPLR